jgi:hypothetical protein
MADARIRNAESGIEEQPKQHASDTKEDAGGKEDPERFFADNAKVTRAASRQR